MPRDWQIQWSARCRILEGFEVALQFCSYNQIDIATLRVTISSQQLARYIQIQWTRCWNC